MGNTRRQVNIYINGKEIENTIKGITDEKKKLTRELNRMVVGSEEYTAKIEEIGKLNGLIRKHSETLRPIPDTYQKMAGGLRNFAGIAGIAFGAEAIVSYGKELFKLGTEMEVLQKKAATVFGQALPRVTAEAERNATAMGLTTQQYIAQAAAIGDLLVPMGFQRKEAADISTTLVNLSGALSEWSGGTKSAKEANDALSSALLGEREELKQFGIAISEADVQARLHEKGLDKLTGKVREQAEATATLEIILEKSVDAQNAYAENSGTLVRQQAELSAKFAEVSEKLATALLPVFSRLVDLAGGVADGILAITGGITDLLNPAQAAAEAFDEQQEKVSKLEEELVPLLQRYDELTGKSELSKDEQAELATVIGRIGAITPSAITKVDEYGNVLAINADKAREFLDIERQRLEFVEKDAIASTEKQIAALKRKQELLKNEAETGGRVNALGSASGIDRVALADDQREKSRRELEKTTRLLVGAEAQLARLRGENLKVEEQSAEASSDEAQKKAQEAEAAKKLAEERQKEAEKEAKRREKEAEREQKDLANQREKLLETLKDYQEKDRLARLDDSARQLEEIRAKYEEQIALTRELEAKKVKDAAEIRMKFLQAQEEELTRVEMEQRAKELADRQAQLEAEIEAEVDAELQKALRVEEARQQMRDYVEEAALSEREQALADLEDQYEAMVTIAQEFGLDLTQVTKAYREKVAQVNAEFDKKDIESQKKAQAARAAAVADAFGAVGNAVGSLIDLVGNKTREAADFSRGLALFQIATKTAEAIAAGIAASAGVPFPGNLAAIAATIGTVLGNVAQAKKLLSEEPRVPQRALGGEYSVTGQQDGRSYSARYIGRPGTGLLPNRPVLLASERGSEYFVAHEDLKNPYVLNHVRAIENLTYSRRGSTPVYPYEDGGFTAGGLAGGTSPLPDLAGMMQRTLQALEESSRVNAQLLQRIDEGIPAVVPDQTIVDLNKRYKKLNDASGGVL